MSERFDVKKCMIPILVLLVIISANAVYGTNDSSYKFGYKVATDNFTGLITVPSTPWNKNPDISEICDSGDGCPGYYDALDNYCLTGQNDKVRNSTACIDGYVQAWKDWCIGNHYKNANYCAKLVVDGEFPMSFINEDKEMLATMPLRSMLFGTTWNFINESNGHGISTQGPNIITSAAQIQKAATNVINRDAKIFGSTSFWNNPTFIMSNITKFSGKITFYEDQIRINTTNGIDPTYTSDPGWDLGGNHTLILDGITPTILLKDGNHYFPSQALTFLKISTHLIELQDKHGDTIRLIR